MILLNLKVVLARRAEYEFDQIQKSNGKLARVIWDHINRLPASYHLDKQLKGAEYTGIRRHRVGDYRILYRLDRDRLIILVITIAHRREVYEG